MKRIITLLAFLFFTSTVYSQPILTITCPNDYDFPSVTTISADGTKIATGLYDIKIWDAENGEQLNVIEYDFESKGNIASITISPDSTKVAVGYCKFIANVYSIESNKEILEVTSYTITDNLDPYVLIGMSAVGFTNDGENLLTGDSDGAMQLWDVNSGKELNRYDYYDWISSIDLSPNNDEIFLKVGMNNIVINTSNGEELMRFPGPNAASTDDWNYFFGYIDDAFYLLNYETKEIVQKISDLTLSGDSSMENVDISPNGQFLLLGGFVKNEEIVPRKIINTFTGEVVKTYDFTDKEENGSPYSLGVTRLPR